MYYFREEYKPWEKINCKSLPGAKRAAARRAAFLGTRIQVAQERFGLLHVLAVKHGRSRWQDLSD